MEAVIGAHLLFWLCGWRLLWRRGNFHAVEVEQEGLPSLSVIVPARNEAQNLPKLLNSLLSQLNHQSPKTLNGQVEILVVDDASEDGTAQVAGALGAKVIPSQSLPEGWTGKNWACHQGAHQAKGELLFFVDADLEFEKNSLFQLRAYFSKVGGALAVLPYHKVSRVYEQFSAYFNVLMAMGTGAWLPQSSHSTGRRVKLVGQAMLISQSDYRAVGGHAAVKNQVLENFHLSPKLWALGIRCETLRGQGLLSMRMFPEGLRQLFEGWVKAFARGSSSTSPGILGLAVLWIFAGMGAPLVFIYAGPNWGALLYFLFAIQSGVFFRRLGSYRWWTWVFYPIPLFFYQGLFFCSLWKMKFGGVNQWRGRQVS